MSPALNMNVMNVCLLWRLAYSEVVDVVDADDSAGGSELLYLSRVSVATAPPELRVFCVLPPPFHTSAPGVRVGCL